MSESNGFEQFAVVGLIECEKLASRWCITPPVCVMQHCCLFGVASDFIFRLV